MLSSRLPTTFIARLLLGLMLVCNLTLCIGWHGLDALDAAMAQDHQAMSSSPMQGLSCHGATADGEQDAAGQACQMHGGLTSSSSPGLPLLAALLALPLLLLPLGTAGSVLDNWLRDPFLRSRGTHPPSWPRRHLMLSVLRH